MTSARGVQAAALLGGAACLFALAAVNAPGPDAAHRLQFGLLASGVILLAFGFGVGSVLRRGRLSAQGSLLTGILLLAAALRLWQLETAVHFYVDEGNFVEGILHLRTEPNIRLMGPFNYVAAFTWVYPYLQWLSSSILGSNLLALRAVSAAFGTLTVAALYRLGRVLFGARVGLLAALALAVFPPHLHFSRLGLNNVADPLFGVLALVFLTTAIRQKRMRDYALAGLMLGLTQYFYEGGRLLYPVLLLSWGLIAAWAWRGQLPGLLLTGLTAALAALPVYSTLLAWDISLVTRLNRRGFEADYWRNLLLAADGGGALWTHLREHVIPPFLHYLTLPDQGAFFYGGHTALILPPFVPVFFGGLLAALRRSRPGFVLLILWLALVALGNSLIEDSVWTARYVAAFPALALALGLGVDAALRWLSSRILGRGGNWQIGRPLVAVGLLVAAVVYPVGYYFGPHLTAYQTQIRPNHDQQDVVFRLRDLPPETRVIWITDDPDLWMPLLVFLTRYWGMPDFEPELMSPGEAQNGTRLDDLDPNVTYAFFVEQEDTVTQALLQARLGLGEPRSSPYRVPREKQYVLLLDLRRFPGLDG
ncbi:MAG: glycosyltransferase family 39 protein [Anaerolineae bacterium]|nr:glycosyltransferase family 39 protein [Anaerolineae bacterium]